MLTEILILLILSVIAVAIFRHLNFPAVLGYLLVGMLMSEHSLGLIHDSHTLEQIAEIGVVFLLFTIGLEVSIPRLIAMRRIVLGIGLVQVVVSTLSTIAIGLWMGLSWQAAFAVGGAMTMSSTAIVVKQLTEQHELHSPHGNIAIGVLLLQDLAVVPFLVLIPLFAAPETESLLLPILYALAKGALAFALIYVIGLYVIRPLTRRVAGSRSNELFTLFILLVALLAAWSTWQLGLSLAMGAFLAGIMLAETEYQHHIETEIRPFRDVLMGLFFISVGTQFDWAVMINETLVVAILTIGLIFGKGIAIMFFTRWAGYDRFVALRSGIALGQGSEFGFALLALALGTGLLEISLSQPIIAAIVFSMILSPLLIRHSDSFSDKWLGKEKKTSESPATQLNEASEDLQGHVIICGFGRTGQNLAAFLKQLDIDYIAIEVDSQIVSEAWEAGEPVFFGDLARSDLLANAGIARARALVISFLDTDASAHILQIARSINDEIPILVRSRDDRPLDHLLQSGADVVIPDTVESSIMLARHTLRKLGIDLDRIDKLTDDVRADNYAMIRAFFHGSVETADEDHQLHSLEVLKESHAVGQPLESLHLGSQIKVISIRRGNTRLKNPESSEILQIGDILVVEGAPNFIKHLENKILVG